MAMRARSGKRPRIHTQHAVMHAAGVVMSLALGAGSAKAPEEGEEVLIGGVCTRSVRCEATVVKQGCSVTTINGLAHPVDKFQNIGLGLVAGCRARMKFVKVVGQATGTQQQDPFVSKWSHGLAEVICTGCIKGPWHGQGDDRYISLREQQPQWNPCAMLQPSVWVKCRSPACGLEHGRDALCKIRTARSRIAQLVQGRVEAAEIMDRGRPQA